jgi:hypothetical protein
VAERDPLAAKLASAGFTPGKRDVPELVALVTGGDEKRADAAIRALVRAPAIAGPALAALLPTTSGDAPAAMLVRALGAVARAGDAGARAAVLATLANAGAPSRARREAAVQCGKLGGDDARDALVARWDAGDLAPDHRRAVVEALGKVGGDAALARISSVAADGDKELARRRDRAVLMIERTGARDAVSMIDLAATPPGDPTLAVTCRAGLEDLLVAELAGSGWAPWPDAPPRPGVVVGALAGPLGPVAAARLRLDLGFLVPLAPADPPDAELPARIAAALAAIRTRLAAVTHGPIRWRLAFAGGGHRRGVVWRTAQAVRAADPALVNDPTATTWEVIVDEARGELFVAPRRFTDDRFAWRVRDVPAASHPTIAAALARLAGPEPADRVWDPFVGSGAELIERDRHVRARSLVGTDLDPDALAAAGENLAAAGLADRAELRQADARTAAVTGVDLVITNPPLGRRLRGDPAALLVAALPGFARALRPGGRLVWITPVPARTEPAARAAGLVLDHRRDVDLGGFTGVVERWTLRGRA